MGKNRIRSLIICSVCVVHLVFLALLLFKSPFLPTKKQRTAILVTTRAPAPTLVAVEKKTAPTAARVSQPIAAAPKKSPERPAPKPAQSHSPTKQTAPKAEKPKSVTAKPQSPAPAPLIPPSLLQELEESIAKFDKADGKKTGRPAAKKSPPALLTLQIDAPSVLSSDDLGDYVSLLTEHLHASLHLPDFGEVKIELTLQQDGTVAKLKVLKTESEQNKKYLESRLPQLRFPHLTGSLAKKNEHSFILTFCNEI